MDDVGAGVRGEVEIVAQAAEQRVADGPAHEIEAVAAVGEAFHEAGKEATER